MEDVLAPQSTYQVFDSLPNISSLHRAEWRRHDAPLADILIQLISHQTAVDPLTG